MGPSILTAVFHVTKHRALATSPRNSTQPSVAGFNMSAHSTWKPNTAVSGSMKTRPYMKMRRVTSVVL